MLRLTTIAGQVRNAVQQRSQGPQGRIVSGSLTLLVGSALVSLLNLIYNVGVARLLGPIAFGEAAAVYTLLMLISCITLSFQLVCAKFVAKNESAGAKVAAYVGLRRRAWLFGIAIASLLILASQPIAAYLNLRSSVLVILLAVGIAFYIPLGVRRGGMQGIYAFRRLAGNYIIEGVVKLGGAILLIHFGLGVNGAIAAVTASEVVAYLFGHPGRELEGHSELALPASFSEGMQAIVFFVGQVVINNVDIILVKHFFAAEAAGLYAAAALVGRVVYMSSWSVVSAMFPISAGIRTGEEESGRVLLTPLLIVLLITGGFTLGLWLFPDLVWRAVFGPAFHHQNLSFYSSLLVLYAAATGVYSLSVVMITYEMSRKIANTAWVQLAFAGAIVLGIFAFHSTLRQVVVVQLIALALLLLTVCLPFLRKRLAPAEGAEEFAVVPPLVTMRKLRLLTEDEVIAEFLRNEFHHHEFDEDRARVQPLVDQPDLSSAAENALRRALLFRRRGGLWRELPRDTQWWEAQLQPADIERLRFFPRAQWRKLSRGRFYVNDIVERIRQSNGALNEGFRRKLQAVSNEIQQEGGAPTSILLIGEDESSPLTIIEGNHRVAAALLVSPGTLPDCFHVLCGLSPRMSQCCWYHTSLGNLFRYAANKLRDLVRDRDADIDRLLELPPRTPAVSS
ncbi:MAG TPA: oligosaccharide flippase family protein [Terriglobales bacterium]|nr:oligosaccharide flippase family protein [Terriglobales bacterium]